MGKLVTDTNDMLDAPAIWTSDDHDVGQVTSWVCDIGNGAIQLWVGNKGDGWTVRVRGCNRRIAVMGLPDRAAAMHEAVLRAQRMITDINDQLALLIASGGE